MNIQTVAIQSFAKFALGSLIFNKIKDIVSIYSSKDMTGSEKRTAVFKDIEDIGFGLSSWVINLGIELAVAYFSTLAGKPIK
jgi:hypothetical protein